MGPADEADLQELGTLIARHAVQPLTPEERAGALAVVLGYWADRGFPQARLEAFLAGNLFSDHGDALALLLPLAGRGAVRFTGRFCLQVALAAARGALAQQKQRHPVPPDELWAQVSGRRGQGL